MKYITKKDLVSSISNRTDMTQVDTKILLDCLIEEIERNYREGNSVRLAGLGTFDPKRRASRMVRNPKTGEKIATKDKTVMVFKPFKSLEILNESSDTASSIKSPVASETPPDGPNLIGLGDSTVAESISKDMDILMDSFDRS